MALAKFSYVLANKCFSSYFLFQVPPPVFFPNQQALFETLHHSGKDIQGDIEAEEKLQSLSTG